MKTYNLDEINKILKNKYNVDENTLKKSELIIDDKSSPEKQVEKIDTQDNNFSELEKFDKAKTRILKYVVYKKRTEKEIKDKFYKEYDENLLEDIIQNLKENGYIDDLNYIKRYINDVKALKNLSLKEIKYKLQAKGIKRKDIDEYFSKNHDDLIEYEKKAAKRIVEKKSSNMDEQDVKTYLIKKGYSEESIGEAL